MIPLANILFVILHRSPVGQQDEHFLVLLVGLFRLGTYCILLCVSVQGSMMLTWIFEFISSISDCGNVSISCRAVSLKLLVRPTSGLHAKSPDIPFLQNMSPFLSLCPEKNLNVLLSSVCRTQQTVHTFLVNNYM